ncbi:MAG: hypothetical protein GF346_08205 [Candidatus Eisenbacteria bacterium]|nr:hypothetical protein [Candidatus Eisenbacteria bacterium]
MQEKPDAIRSGTDFIDQILRPLGGSALRAGRGWTRDGIGARSRFAPGSADLVDQERATFRGFQEGTGGVDDERVDSQRDRHALQIGLMKESETVGVPGDSFDERAKLLR